MTLVVAVLLLIGDDVIARVGGGQSFSGGGGGGGGSGGGDGGAIIELVWLLIRLIIYWPEFGIPLTIFIIIIAIVSHKKGTFANDDAQVYDGGAHHGPGLSARAERRRQEIARLLNSDPGFSSYVFLDFCNLLYARIHEYRGQPTPGMLRPFVAPEILSRLASESVRVSNVTIGSMTIDSVQRSGSEFSLKLEVISNVDETTSDGHTQRWFYREILSFRRDVDVISPAPSELASLTCPSCGAAAETEMDATCVYCGNVVNTGEFGWVVDRVHIEERRVAPPVDTHLFPGGDEPGVNRPSIKMPNLGAAKRALSVRDTSFTWGGFTQHVKHSFHVLQDAWSSLQWERARPYETDNLFQTHRFWIERYKADGLQNRVEGVQIEHIEICKVDRDPYYEVITVRIYASMLDYTENASGRVVGGNRKARRRFSEYWTFLRRIGVTSNPERELDGCPSCGAPVSGVNPSGVCGYCQAKVVSGNFDWTLAQIDQDETYEG